MAKARDYKREYQVGKEKRKAREAAVATSVPRQLADDFAARCDLNGVTRSGVLRRYIERYTYEGFDQPEQ